MVRFLEFGVGIFIIEFFGFVLMGIGDEEVVVELDEGVFQDVFGVFVDVFGVVGDLKGVKSQLKLCCGCGV